MGKYKLIYFNAKGRAEIARFLFAIAGEEYEDFRFEREQWPEHKANTPFLQVPVLEITEDGKTTQIAQSHAIWRYLANKFNLAGKTDLEKAKADMIVDQLNDLWNQIIPVFFEQDEEKKKALREKLYGTVIPQFIELFEKYLAKNNTQYFAGDELTWADVSVFNAIERLGDKREAVLEKAPLLKALYERVNGLSKVQEWLEKRPKTDL